MSHPTDLPIRYSAIRPVIIAAKTTIKQPAHDVTAPVVSRRKNSEQIRRDGQVFEHRRGLVRGFTEISESVVGSAAKPEIFVNDNENLR